jgi:hypothetical protein
MSLRRRAPALVAGAVLSASVGLPAPAAAAPDQEMPFPCAESWTGTTRPGHTPSPLAVDFNRPQDMGRLVLASAPGVVRTVADTEARGYGKWIRIDHGDGHSSVYAHLKAQWVSVGQFVDQGAPIGRVGDSGGVSGAHLHYEQRLGTDLVHPFFARLPFAFGAGQESLNCPDLPLAGDWDGDGAAQVAVFRRDAGAGTFERWAASGSRDPIRLGRGTDLPVTGDWDGDGVTDVGVRRQAPRVFLLRRGDGSRTRIRLGMVGDQPVTGDWDGDGVTQLGVWRPRATRFRLLRRDGTHLVVRMGSPSSQPVTGDWNGDGVTDLGVFDRATATFTLRVPAADGTAVPEQVFLGAPDDLPVTGDWNGDGVTDLGVWDPATATYTLRISTPATSARTGSGSDELRTLLFGRPR